MPQFLRTIGEFRPSLWPTIRPELEDVVEPLMAMDSQMKLIILTPGHNPSWKSHPHGCGGLMSHFRAPICTNDERNLPVRQLAAGIGIIWPTLQAPCWPWSRK